MIITLQRALCLHAQADDLTFLNQVRNRVAKLLGDRIRVFELRSLASHATAMLAVRQATDGLVLIFAHGTSDYLHGGEYQSLGESTRFDKFITRAELGAFKGKVVFCMSCYSNGMAQDCLQSGALAFVGFDAIPFTRFDPVTDESIGSRALVKHCQELIAAAILATLERFLSGRYTLDESVDYLRLWISQNAVSYVRNSRNDYERREVAALFLKVKDGVRYHGTSSIVFK